MKDLMDFIMSYSYVLADGTHIDVVNLIWLISVFSIIFIYNGVKSFSAQRDNVDDKLVQELKLYHLERSFFCILAGVVVSYIIILLAGQKVNIALNYVIIPFFGYIATNYINAYFKEHGWIMNKYPKKQETKEDNVAPAVIINNNNLVNDESAEDVSMKEVTEDDIKEHGAAFFFNLFGNQHLKLEEEMRQQSEILTALKSAQIEDRAQELENRLYAALSAGYTTLEKDKIIRNKYYIYADLLGGNGRIKHLFEKYEQLKIYDK